MKRRNFLGTFLTVIACAWSVSAQAQETVDLGYALAGIGDVTGDAVADIAVGDPAQGQVFIFSGADGTLRYTLDVPKPSERTDLRRWLTGVEDRNDDAVPDIAVGDPISGQGMVFSGADGALLSTSKSRISYAETVLEAAMPELGRVGGDMVLEDVNGDMVADMAVGHPTDGQVFVFSGADGALLYTLKISSPQALFFGTACVERTQYVQRGDWRTLVTLWRAEAGALFRAPAGAQIKVRRGVGWFAWDTQKQTLDGINTKNLSVGHSWILSRMQMKVTQSAYVTYTYCPVGPEELPRAAR